MKDIKKKHSKRVAVIGGGTGSSVILRGLKKYTENITAIVTVADDGGGSGVLREDLGMLPPGDIRSCILSLADEEGIMQKLLNYRFEEGRLKGQSFGNLFIAAMNGISGNFVEAIKNVSDVMAIKGTVLPVSLESVTLSAELCNGEIVNGESQIPLKAMEKKSKIKRVSINPKRIEPLPEAIEAIMSAQAVIVGPGSLYTSIIPNLLVDGVEDALRATKAKRFYIPNIMTQPGETDGYAVSDHIKALFDHAGGGIVDYVVVNKGKIDNELEERYKGDGAVLVKIDDKKIRKLNVNLIEGDFVRVRKGLIRHDAEKLASILIETIMDKR